MKIDIDKLLPDDIQRANDIVSRLCKNGHLSMSIPVDNRDEDMVLCRVIRNAQQKAPEQDLPPETMTKIMEYTRNSKADVERFLGVLNMCGYSLTQRPAAPTDNLIRQGTMVYNPHEYVIVDLKHGERPAAPTVAAQDRNLKEKLFEALNRLVEPHLPKNMMGVSPFPAYGYERGSFPDYDLLADFIYRTPTAAKQQENE